ncbi:MAG: DNA-protecting protein DprA [Gammaproteobacteria bacterium]|nr:MAG: DNA-protecting protein DprA [Gammaproteobacteria bacterium]
MDLEQMSSWLGLAQQPYPLINEFLKQLASAEVDHDVGNLIDFWLKKHRCPLDKTQRSSSIEWLQQSNHHLVNFLEFPEALKTISNPPAVLFLAGDPKLLYQPQLALVGSRKPTSGGRENAILFASELARSGLVILSGLAIGIDGLAHKATLEVGGLTAAVLGCGHLTCYPAKHQELFNAIKTKGLIISEFTPDTPVRAYQFPRRNRIISGLSLGVLVVEAAIKSGSLITCRLAADQGREVFAIPGDITNPMSRGCHHLIRHGACLVDSPDQILEELNFSSSNKQIKPSNLDLFRPQNDLSKEENLLLVGINRHPTSIDNLLNRTSFDVPHLLSLLFNLEQKNKIFSSADGYYKKQAR